MRHPEGCEEAEAPASQHENPTRTSRLPSVRVVLLVLGSLLAAALIIIYRLSVVWMSNRDVQTLKEENEDLSTFFSGGDDISLAGASGEGENLEEVLRPPECEAGWELHGGNCYYFSNYKSSWTESRDSCRGQGGDLVKIDSREEQMFLIGRLNNLIVDESDKFWIGLTKAEKHTWFWVDGSTLNERSLTFWSDSMRNKCSVGEDCVRMGEKGGSGDLMSWFFTSCKHPQKSICEKAAKTKHMFVNE